MEIESSPPKKLSIVGKQVLSELLLLMSTYHLNIKYCVNDASSVEQVGIIYKWDGLYGDEHCPKDHPDDITEVNHCGFKGDSSEKDWRYIFSPK